ncbi:MAG: hypothetical protein GWP15_02615 [Nitrospirae bacterium]|nr:hypothetical protein [Nitrospirota bacterium]
MKIVKAYRVKSEKLPGTNFREVRKKAFKFYQQIKKRTKRKPYVRSAYFKKDKIFLDLFWSHLFEKRNFVDLMRRIKFYPCALELIRNSSLEPTSKENPNKSSEILHRFVGVIPNKEIFFVQIKENKRNGQKYLISVFPDR